MFDLMSTLAFKFENLPSRVSGRWRQVFGNEEFFLTEERCQAFQCDAFRRVGLDWVEAKQHLRQVIDGSGIPAFNELNDSQHWVLFAGIAAQRPSVRRVLEIGTFDATFTRVLTSLFPNADIVTIDLPDQDAQVRQSYGRDEQRMFNKFLERRTENLNNSRIQFIQRNAFFLPELRMGLFDLIWLDGDHTFPALSWDFCNSFHALERDGMIVCDDVFRYPSDINNAKADNKAVLDYLVDREICKVEYILKRSARVHAADPRHRKYLGVLQKC
jgi:predicted O-methyltransferase YrrM